MKKYLMFAVLALSTVPIPTLAAAEDEVWRGMMGGYGYPLSMMWGGWITTILVWIVLILGIILLLQKINKKK